MSLIAFAIGLVVLFKNNFRLGNRAITQAYSRSIALILMAPLALQFCASIFIVMNNPDIVQFYDDGTAGVNPDAFRSIANSVGTLEFISVGIAVLLVIFYIYNAPRVGSVPATASASRSQGGAQPPINRTPDIMTVAEAAAYMRVTEADVLGLIDQGKLGAARIGDSYRIARIAIEDFMRQA